ncbi:LOW QUALITY PROTEIN: cilia- and flagella-associated protein 74 [Pristis pectinata]|uniref:LOW QUALITY PROTEIN: cilia- and flagella-associated protein 74 n=1 Tax=Pristis pectinata TaxID=685728 RepID=UPI00223E24B9|nr:LOW QUALITY PROTEIN: cilia- and flagella-associated protein 74 [Pristis pectinata]
MEEQLCEHNEAMMESDDGILGDDISEITWEESEEEVDSSHKKRLSYSEKAQMRKCQRIQRELEFLLQEKDLEVQKIREELKECRRRMEILKEQRDKVEEDIQEQETANNIAALFRLRAQHRRLCEELREEEDIHSKIDLTLQETEYELFKVELEQAKLLQLHEQHKKDEEEYEVQRALEAKQRLEANEAVRLQAERRIKTIKKKPMKDLKDQEMEHRKAVENAKKYNQKAIQFLKESMARVREEQAVKELQIREDLEKRMQSVLSLKKNIELNQENQRAIQLRRKARAASEKQKQKRKETLILESGVAQQFIIYAKHQQEFEKKKQEFIKQQKTSKAEIMAKILREESNMEKKKRVNPALFPETSKTQDNVSGAWKPKKKLYKYLGNISEDKELISIDEQKEWQVLSSDSEEETVTGQNQDHHEPDINDDEDEESLNQPEFSGLWDYEQKPCQDEPTDKHFGAGTSKMEQEILARQLDKQRSGIIHKQVAAGREFKGCPFYSKPAVVHFQNFDIGKTYKKRATLINASYGITYCKLIDISDHLKDFIEVEFKPSGPVSAGMSCEMTVIFKPMLNEDLEGEIMFRAQTGSFTVPLKCTTKKCDLSVDKTFVDFGSHVIGKTITQTVTLTNRGARGTHFEFLQMNFTSSVSKEPGSKSTPSAEIEESKFHGSEVAFTHIQTFCKIINALFYLFELPEHEEDLFIIDHPVSNEIKIGQVTKDSIDPFSSIKLPIIFLPTVPGNAQADLELVFPYGAHKNIPIKVQAQAVDVPVWVSNPNIDLKICMYDRLYQDAIRVHNRASLGHQVKFVVCKELRNHLEFLPKSGFIQAHSSLSFQLKFLPRKSLPEDANIYFNTSTLVLEAPMNIWVANQVRLIPFTVHAVVTSSDIEIDHQTIDFGPCSIYETVRKTVRIRNKSILSQEFGFVGVPEYVDVQPNDGFGVLLPLERLSLDIMFKAKQAKEYNFELICKSEINRDFQISCKAVGVVPPLHLSHSVVHFAATALNNIATVTLYVVNSHTSQNEFTHQVPRIGSGEIAPVGPTTFEFIVPESSSLTIVPAVGTVLPGQKCKVVLTFKPTLSDLQVQEEAVRMLCWAEETRRILEKQETESTAKSEQDTSNKKKPQSKQKDLKEHSPGPPKPPVKETNTPFKPPDPADIAVDSDAYNAALASLLRNFKEEFHSFVIPCFIMHGDATSYKKEGYLPYSIHNTLYLEVNCPTVAPPLVLVSCNKRNIVDFGENAVGHRVLKKVMVQNISQDDLDLKSTVLDPGGPFQLLNFLRALQPGETQNLSFSFTPTASKVFYESMEIRTAKANCSLILTGCGVDPIVTCSVEKVLDMGYVLANQKRTVTYQLQNATRLHVMFDVKLGSLSYTKYKDQQELPPFLASNEISDPLVGTQNFGGQSVFSVSPVKGCIEAMQTQEFEVTFSPDHESLCYSDVIYVELFDKVSHTIQLKGAAREHLMFVEGGDPIDVPVESLSILPSNENMDGTDVPRPLKSVLLTLKSIKSDNKYTTALREFQVGCIRSTQAAGKKSVEFIIDNPQAVHVKGFTIDPIRGVLEAGNTRTITVRWTPPSGHDALQIISATVKMSIKGDITENYEIILMAVVVRQAQNSGVGHSLVVQTEAVQMLNPSGLDPEPIPCSQALVGRTLSLFPAPQPRFLHTLISSDRMCDENNTGYELTGGWSLEIGVWPGTGEEESYRSGANGNGSTFSSFTPEPQSCEPQ